MKVAVVTGIHGDEYSSLLVDSILREYTAPNVRVFGPVNVSGLSSGTRVNPIDNKDPNRVLGTSYKGISGKLMRELFEETSECDILLDIHNLVGQKTAPTGSLFSNLLPEQQSINLKIYNFLGVNFVDVLDVDDSPEIKTTLIYQTQQRAIPGLVIEVSDLQAYSITEATKLAKSIVKLSKLKSLSLLQNESKLFAHTCQFTADSAGLFMPSTKLKVASAVIKGSYLGTFVPMEKSQANTNLYATENGVLQNISLSRFVAKGDLLVNIVGQVSTS